MARTLTTAQSNALAALGRREFVRVYLENPNGVMTDVTTLGGFNWFESCDLDLDDVDQPVNQATIRLRRDRGATLSLSPTRTDSTLNRDASSAFAPFLDAGRAVYVDVAVLDASVATAPTSGDWQRVFVGVVDSVDPAKELVSLVARDQGARLQDAWLEQETAMVVSGGTPVAMETLIQTMLDTALGAGQVTLYTPTSPSYLSTSFGYRREPLYDAILRLVQSIGWDCRYKWDAGTSTFRLTLFQPPRTKTTPDVTLGPSRYSMIPRFVISRETVRNYVRVGYTAPGATGRSSVVVTDAASIARYKLRTLIIEEAGDSTINTDAEALVMANALLADLKDPRAMQDAEMPLFWPVQGGDLIRFTNNGVHYNTNQDLAVINVRHSLVSQGVSKTTLTLRGSPAGAYRSWLKRGSTTAGGVETLPPTLSASPDYGSLFVATFVISGAPGANAPVTPFLWRTRQLTRGDVGTWTPYVTASFPADLSTRRDLEYDTQIEIEVQQADGQTERITVDVAARPDAAARGGGTGLLRGVEDDARSGQGGIATPFSRIITDGIYDRTGATIYMDTQLGRIGAGLAYPGGATIDGLRPAEGGANVTETRTANNTANVDSTSAATARRGAIKGDSAIDSGNQVTASAVDFARPFSNKHFGNVPDDASSDRRAATANEKTGGARGYGAIDVGGVVVSGGVDLSRGYTGKHMGNVPDDASSDRRAATATEKTGAARGYGAIDAGGTLNAGTIDFSRAQVGQHMGNIPDDATSDRRAATATEKTGGARGAVALDGSNKLQTGVTSSATAADGNAGIESGKGAGTKAARNAGTATGRVGDDLSRGGAGGLPLFGSRYETGPIYDVTGAQLLLDPTQPGALTAYRTLTSIKDRAKMRLSGGPQSISNGTETRVDFDVKDFDVGVGIATSGTSSRITIPTDHFGLWVLHLYVQWDANATGYRWAAIRDSAGNAVAMSCVPAASGEQTAQHLFALVNDPGAAQWYQAFVKQSSGSTLNANNNLPGTSFECFRLW